MVRAFALSLLGAVAVALCLSVGNADTGALRSALECPLRDRSSTTVAGKITIKQQPVFVNGSRPVENDSQLYAGDVICVQTTSQQHGQANFTLTRQGKTTTCGTGAFQTLVQVYPPTRPNKPQLTAKWQYGHTWCNTSKKPQSVWFGAGEPDGPTDATTAKANDPLFAMVVSTGRRRTATVKVKSGSLTVYGRSGPKHAVNVRAGKQVNIPAGANPGKPGPLTLAPSDKQAIVQLVQPSSTGPLSGISGAKTTFERQTGQQSQVIQAFLGWGQGESWGKPFAGLLPSLAPIPLLTLGTKGRGGSEAITPAGIASGQGDDYLIALNSAIAAWGRGIYVRPLAEMNNPGNPYSGYGPNGPRDNAHSPERIRKAFARIYVILHGGSRGQINGKLRGLGLPPLRGTGDLAANDFPRLRVVWSPLAGGRPTVAGNSPSAYLPGPGYMDVGGGDIYDEGLTDNAPWPELEGLYRLTLSQKKTFSVPEWGLFGVDDPAFIEHMCTYLKTHRSTEMQAFVSGQPGSIHDLASKPKSRAAYRRCITPLGGALPTWAGSTNVKVSKLALSPNPDSGPSPLDVQFGTTAKLSLPIKHWQLFFGDGAHTSGDGSPPSTVPHSYASDGVYQATLVVFPSPPFTIETARFLASTIVTVGTTGKPIVSFSAAPPAGKAPLKVVFPTILNVPGTVINWEVVFGDGNVLQRSGRPHFPTRTYQSPGQYRAILHLTASGGREFVSYADVTVR